MSMKKSKYFDSTSQAIDMLKKYYNVKTDLGLCKHFGLSKGAIGMWRTRDTVPPWAIFLIEQINCSETPNRQSEDPGEYNLNPSNQAAMLGASIDALMEHMDEADRAYVFASTQEIRWKRGVEKELSNLREEIEALQKALKK